VPSYDANLIGRSWREADVRQDAGLPKSRKRLRFRGRQVDCRGKQAKHNGRRCCIILIAAANTPASSFSG
jgi:hypothetical protein